MLHEKAVLKYFAIFNIHRETPVLDSLFNKVVGLQACNFIKKKLQQWCFPVNIAKFLKKPILKSICEQLFLKKVCKVLFNKTLFVIVYIYTQADFTLSSYWFRFTPPKNRHY